MTTIYELEKQATPGPWGAQLNGREIYPHPSPPGTRIAELSRRDLSPEGVHKPFGEDKQAGANSKLLLHCRNNFMKALEALKAWQETYNAWLVSDHPFEIEFPDSAALIERLENIDEST